VRNPGQESPSQEEELEGEKNGFNPYSLHLIHFFNRETLNLSRFSVYSASPTYV